MMHLNVEIAVHNNIAWCGLVCDTHGLEHYTKGNTWGLYTEAPMFYPEVITVNKGASLEDVQHFTENGNVHSIKDSYANLDFLPFGFKKLFDAEWICHKPVADKKPLQSKWRVITVEKDFLEWTSRSGLEGVINPNLLKYENVQIFILEEKEGVSGFITNVDAGVVGISNVISVGRDNESLWKEIPKLIASKYPDVYLVGYEHGSELHLAKKSGWESLGPLRVWMKSE
ncbi:MAG: hypothetical protein ACO1OT_00280 [Heyndrickxia sp.]